MDGQQQQQQQQQQQEPKQLSNEDLQSLVLNLQKENEELKTSKTSLEENFNTQKSLIEEHLTEIKRLKGVNLEYFNMLSAQTVEKYKEKEVNKEENTQTKQRKSLDEIVSSYLNK